MRRSLRFQKDYLSFEFAPSIGEIFRSSVLNIVTTSRYFFKLLILIEMYGVKDVERELQGFDGGDV